VSLAELIVDDVRCIQRAELCLHAGQNLIWGGNGSGKTSLLESIFLLGRGRSFRTRNSERLIRHGRERLVVFGRTGPDVDLGNVDLGGSETPISPGHSLGVQVSRAEGTVARIGGTNARSLTELTQVFPVQIIDPGIHKLVEEGGHRRRRWMDWGVFHVEPQFGDWWLRYTRALKQRNAALRSQPDQARAWDPELARLGESIGEARRRFVDALVPHWQKTVLALSDLEPELHYFRGWAQDSTLADALAASKASDEAKRVTHPGPHRSDIVLRLRGKPAREVLSRGQQKLVAVALTLSQLHLLQSSTQVKPTLLLDDPAAELDGVHLRRFIDQVMQLRSQLVLTSLYPESHLFGTPNRVFHVEQGQVTET
jgi:DNA replication and repair protein RecF